MDLEEEVFLLKKLKKYKIFIDFCTKKNYNNTQASDIIEAEMEATPERDEILQFIKDSQRGIMKGYFTKI